MVANKIEVFGNLWHFQLSQGLTALTVSQLTQRALPELLCFS